jgi:FKBP-type peptidyl-prolyl cis-trans isomerase FkpA
MFVLRRSILALMLALAVTACGGSDSNPNIPTPTPQGPANLVVEDLTVGTGAEATGGRLLTVAYNLYHYDPAGNGGRGQLIQGPAQFQFRQGTNGVIQGFEQGTHGMLVGGIRRLTIPPSLAYGAGGNSNAGIAGNEWIVFDVQLTAVAD